MINFRDFFPRVQAKRFAGMVTDLENLRETMVHVNQWIEEDHIDVINVETVIMSSNSQKEEDQIKAKIEPYSNTVTSHYQMIRVWFRVDTSAFAPVAQTGVTQRLG